MFKRSSDDRAPRKQPESSYEDFSEIYDLLGFHRFTKRALTQTQQFLAESGLVVHRLLDLGCGTGHYAIAMAKMGLDVTGIDGSRGMIKQAKQNSARRGDTPTWKVGSFTSFRVGGTYDLITCWFDSLNHITTDRDLLTCFRRVRNHLAPGGAFLFDVNTPVAFRERWCMTNYRSTSDYTVHEHGLADPGSDFGWFEIEAYVKRGRTYQRYKMPFVQRGLTARLLTNLMTKARFRDLGIEPFEPGDQMKDTTRLLVSARI
jgi:SAM-dependent methyltransferase